MMYKIYKLKNTIKQYEWGSPSLIPEFLGVKNPSNAPFAEMWMGTHKVAPSFADESEADSKGEASCAVSLKEIAGDLPFLFKLLAVDKPLSIQAHPDKEKALEGFSLEEDSKFDIKSPTRNYKDPNPKHELLCALSRFSLMAGLRNSNEIDSLFLDFVKVIPQLKEIFLPLRKSLKVESLAVFFRFLFDLTDFEREYIHDLLIKINDNFKSELINEEQWALMKKFAKFYPEDPAVLSPLYLNLISLKPGQIIYIPAGNLHSYLSGFGVELMTASDNVLRGGLTPKYVDIPELMRVVSFNPLKPKIDTPSFESDNLVSGFNCNFEDLSLLILKNKGTKYNYLNLSPSICLVTEGGLETEGIIFKKGESFFIPEEIKSLEVSGNFSAFFATANQKFDESAVVWK